METQCASEAVFEALIEQFLSLNHAELRVKTLNLLELSTYRERAILLVRVLSIGERST
jgi:hypothetical protein